MSRIKPKYREILRLSSKSQFCYYIQQDEEKRQATMHIPRKPGERIEVDWAGDPACIIDRVTGENIKAGVFVAVLPYSQYTFVEAFTDQKQKSWLRAHIDMYAFFGGVSKLLVSDNCKAAVIHNNNWYTPKLNTSYHELAAHYDTTIIPPEFESPKTSHQSKAMLTIYECHDIADLIHKRRRQSSTIFCSQYPSEEWYDQLGGANNPLAEAVLDRIIHDAYELRIE